MTRVVLRVAAIAAGIGCLFIGAAQGGTLAARAPRLALMPLPMPALGAAALRLPLDPDSGVDSNAEAARNATGDVTAAKLRGLGRITGYSLDYKDGEGHALSTGHGLLEVQTGVELYRSAAAARAGFAFRLRAGASDLRTLRAAAGVSLSVSKVAAKGLGTRSFAQSERLKLAGKPQFYGMDVAFLHGRLIADVSVSAADRRSLRAYTLSLARRLESRIRGVLLERIKGSPVPLPAPRPFVNLRFLALKRLDLGDGVIKRQAYGQRKGERPRTDFVRLMNPAGAFVFLEERLDLFDTPLEASFRYALQARQLFSSKAMRRALQQGSGGRITRYQPTAVLVTGGDEARAVRATVTISRVGTVIEGIILMRIGRTTEFLIAASPTTVPLTEEAIQGLVSSAARRARTGLHE